MFLKVYIQVSICFKISYVQKCENCDKSKFYQYFVFTKKILHRFASLCISLIFTYCLFVEKRLVTIKLFRFNFFGGRGGGGGGGKMCDKMAISAYILKIVENDQFLRYT